MALHWPQRRCLRVVAVTLSLCLVPYVFSRLDSPWRRVAVISNQLGEGAASSVETLKIVSYNIAHGRGLARSNWGGGDRNVRMIRLKGIADLLCELDGDVVVLNEVDFDSSWSGGVNQAEYLAQQAGYAYRIEQRNLDFRVLFWTWRFGNAVLSKYPITKAQVVELPSYSSWETALVGKKRAVLCDLGVGPQAIRVLAAHLSHRSESLRGQSATVICEIAGRSELPIVVAGDLNSTPPGFPNSKSDAEGRNAIVILDESQCFRRSPTNGLLASEAFTFPANDPKQVIDWVLIPADWKFADYCVVPSQLSDHRPVVAEIELQPIVRK